MIQKIKELFYKRILDQISFSQEGEDKILERIFGGKRDGFFIDVGAHHPIRFSNTYKFYLKNWKGLNIDAMPGSMDVFRKIRSRDINLEIAISDKDKELTYYMFDEPALNGFSDKLSDEREKSTVYKIIDRKLIYTQRLDKVLSEHLPPNQIIDFISIDVEGLDLEVLQSNDWEKFRPRVVLIELLDTEAKEKDPIYKFITDQGYSFISKAYYTYFFIDDRKNA